MSVTSDEVCSRISAYTESLIRGKGYPLEIYNVTTEDGYINTLYRIPHNRTEVNEVKTPILMVHGLVSSAAESVNEDRQLGYYLSDKGYDVWIANSRGTTYSRGHTQYHHITNAVEYWTFSFHEIGYYDLPSFIDFILEKTGFTKLFYTGVSQGCCSLSILLSTRREYNDKISLACFMCPAVFFKYSSFFPSKLMFVHVIPSMKWIRDKLGLKTYEVPYTRALRTFQRHHGLPGSFSASLLVKIWSLIAGHRNPEHTNEIDFRELGQTTPNSACFKQLLHFSQLMKDKRFGWFDYGSIMNEQKYGSENPPDYDLSSISAPIAVFYSKNDNIYGEQDMVDLSKKLGNCVYLHLVENEKFNHMDFVINENVIPLLYEHISRKIQEYENVKASPRSNK